MTTVRSFWSMREVVAAVVVFAAVAIGIAGGPKTLPCGPVDVDLVWCPNQTGNQSCTNVNPTGNPPTCPGYHIVPQTGNFGSGTDNDQCARVVPNVQVPCVKWYKCVLGVLGRCQDSGSSDTTMDTTAGDYIRVDCDPEDCSDL